MRIALLLLLTIVVLRMPALADIESDIPATNRVILRLGGWEPTEAETQQALVGVEAFLKDHKKSNRQILANLKNYRVQFIGFGSGDWKTITCNFFPAPQNGKDRYPDWKRQRVAVMDGGFWYWQIDYELKSGRCKRLRSNGYAKADVEPGKFSQGRKGSLVACSAPFPRRD